MKSRQVAAVSAPTVSGATQGRSARWTRPSPTTGRADTWPTSPTA